MNDERILFVCFELTEALSRQLEDCPGRDRVYLEDPAHLETRKIDDKRYIGKTIKEGAPVDRFEDPARSVVSLMNRVISDWTLRPAEVLVLAAEAHDDSTTETQAAGAESLDEFDYSRLVD